MKNFFLLLFIAVIGSSCAVHKSYNPSRKFSPEQLLADYTIFQNSLEESHPSLYWYTPKDSMDFYFGTGRAKLTDSLTETQFRNVLSYVVSKIHCGHTSVRGSKGALDYFDNRSPSFPLFIKAWPDTVVVTANLNRKDSLVTRGVILKSIDGKPMARIIDSLFSFLSADGYNTTHKYQTLSNGSSFRNLYASVFGLKQKTPVEFIDTAGRLRTAILTLYNPKADTPKINGPRPRPLSKKEVKKLILQSQRSLRVDTTLNTAFMELNTFTKGNKLRSFFRHSFQKLKEDRIKNLVVDIRGNGGGSVTLSNLLTKYIADAPFKVSDSLYAIRRGSAFGKYRSERFFNWLFLRFFTRKKKDGYYHFGLFENKKFKPKEANHFDGTTYIITGGNTFSAASLFAKAVKPQEDVIVVGEETGGGAYGNTAWLIPDVTLPNTGVRFRLPLFRLVIDKQEKKGHGILPEEEALPTVRDIRRGVDYKMEKVKELIRTKSRDN